MKTPSKRRRLDPTIRKKEILSVATSLIAQLGYYGVTVQKIAEGCGLTVAGLLHYFPSKDALLVGVLENRDKADIEAVQMVVPDQRKSKNEYRLFLDELVLRNLNQREIVRLFSVLSAESLDIDHPAHNYFMNRTEQALFNMQANAENWHPDPENFAITLFSFLDGLQLLWLRNPNLDMLKEWRRFSDKLFE